MDRAIGITLLLVTFAIPTAAQVTPPPNVPAPDPKGDEIARLRTRIAELTKDAGQIDAERLRQLSVISDSLAAFQCRDLLKGLRKRPAWGEEAGRCLWGTSTFRPLDLASVSAAQTAGSIYTDILSATFFGPIRTSIGTLVAAAEEDAPAVDETRAALQRLITGGGNLIIGVQYPAWVGFSNEDRIGGSLVVLGRGGLDLKPLGAEQSSLNSKGALAVLLRARALSDDRQLEAIASYKAERIWQPNLSEVAEEPGNLIFGQFTLGTRIWQSISLTWAHYFCSRCSEVGLKNQFSVTAQRPF